MTTTTTTPNATMSGAEIVDLCRKHTIFEWSPQGSVDPIPVARAEGIYFYTPEGKRYLDFNSQLMCVNIGHGDPRVVHAIQQQVATLAYGLGNWYLVRGDKAQARQAFERSVQSGGWPGFGFIVSEVELRRLR